MNRFQQKNESFGHPEDQRWQGATVPYNPKKQAWVLPGGEYTQSKIRALEIAKRIADALAKSEKQKIAA